MTLVIRSTLAALALAFALPAAQAQAGIITVSYSVAGGSVDFSAPHVSPTAGSATFAISGFRATAAATFGTFTNISLISLSLTGTDPGAGTFQNWSGASLFPYTGSGTFSGLNAAGTGFAGFGGFFVFASLTGAAFGTHGSYGSFGFPGSALVFLTGSGGGGGSGSGCFNGYGSPGACTAFTAYTPPFSASLSAPTAVQAPGFNVIGAEIAREVAMEPVPEPSTAILLGLGLLGLARAKRSLRRRA